MMEIMAAKVKEILTVGGKEEVFFFFDRGKEEVRTDVKHDKCRNNLLDLWCI
jgi:hypothetical protein